MAFLELFKIYCLSKNRDVHHFSITCNSDLEYLSSHLLCLGARLRDHDCLKRRIPFRGWHELLDDGTFFRAYFWFCAASGSFEEA